MVEARDAIFETTITRTLLNSSGKRGHCHDLHGCSMVTVAKAAILLLKQTRQFAWRIGLPMQHQLRLVPTGTDSVLGRHSL